MPVGSLNSDLSQNFGIFGSQVFFSGALSGPVGTELTIGGNGATPVFNYNPFLGNLLLDISISGAGPDTGIGFDSENPSTAISMAARGIMDPNPEGLVTMFSDVPPPPPIASTTPEPGSMLLFGTGALAILRYVRKKSYRHRSLVIANWATRGILANFGIQPKLAESDLAYCKCARVCPPSMCSCK